MQGKKFPSITHFSEKQWQFSVIYLYSTLMSGSHSTEIPQKSLLACNLPEHNFKKVLHIAV